MIMSNDLTTKDFNFAATLIANGYELKGSHKEGMTVFFAFLNHNPELTEKLQQDFNSRMAFVNVNKFVQAQSRLRKELDTYRK
jgi:hypothetical protein